METLTILSITTLGGVCVSRGELPTERITAQKTAALLVYLAYTGQPHSREHLADLLWHERNPEQASGSLRMAIMTLRKSFEPYLQVSRQTVGFVPNSYRLDAHALMTAVSDFEKANGVRSRTHERQLSQALDGYHGEFLRDFFGGSPEFEAWIESVRHHLLTVYVQGVTSLAEYWSQDVKTSEALLLVQRALQFDPLNESLNNALILLTARRQGAAAAVEHFHAYRDRLERELEAAPSARTLSAVHLIGTAPNEPSLVQQNGSISGTVLHTVSLIGRDHLLMEIVGWGEDSNHPLLTLVGPGGIGKTRAALAAADLFKDNGLFPDGVFFVPLNRFHSASQIAPAVAQALGYRLLSDGRSVRQQVIDYVRTKRILLVLDNFEHLLDGADFAAELAQCPHVRVLVTSREPLNIPEETLLTVPGLFYPSPHTQLTNYDAGKLFAAAVRRAFPDYVPTATDQDAIATICRLVDGSPLGLLLSAAWIDVLTPTEIAALIRESIQSLENTIPGQPERHHSVQAVFAVTLERLPPQLRAMLMRLAVFRGGCTRHAAETVTGAGLRDLQTLASRTLLTRHADGRFTIHELLRRYLEDQLHQTQQYASARDAHSAYFLHFLIERDPDIKGKRQQDALREIDEEFENIRAAWEWACENQALDRLESALDALYWYCEMQRRQADRLELLRLALETVQHSEHDLLYARVLARCWQTPAEGRKNLRQALRIALRHESERDIAECVYLRGRAALLDNRDAAHKLFARAYDLMDDPFYHGVVSSDWAVSLIYAGHADQAEIVSGRELAPVRRSGNRIYLANLLYNQASSLATRGANAEANRFHEEARAVLTELGQFLSAADIGAWGMGVTALREGKFDRARRRAQELLELAQEVHAQVSHARALCTLSAVTLIDGDPVGSRALAQEATDMLGTHPNATYADSYLAVAAVALRDVDTARIICRRWLPLAVRVKEHVLTSLLLIPAAAVLASAQQDERAVECLSLALNAPASMGRWAQAVFDLYALPEQLISRLPLDKYRAAWERGEALNPQAVVDDL